MLKDRSHGSPLLIRCELASPLSGADEHVAFDAILSGVIAAVSARGKGAGASITSRDRPIRFPLPLAREQGVWCASHLWPEQPVRPRRMMERTRPALEFAHLIAARQINVNGGPTRARQREILVWPCHSMVARVVGNAAEIRKLLRSVSAVGANTAHGFGRVWRWEVGPAPDDGATWREWGGVLRRPMPDPNGRMIGLEPPYWFRPWWRPGAAAGEPAGQDWFAGTAALVAE